MEYKKQIIEESPEQEELKEIGSITIRVFDDLRVIVNDFPSDHGMAIMILCNALAAVNAHFINENANRSNIVMARPGASMADILKMSRN